MLYNVRVEVDTHYRKEKLKMYICNRCGAIFEEYRIKTYQEYRGEFWGFPAYEEMTYAYCPECGDESFDDYYPDDEDEEDWEDEE